MSITTSRFSTTIRQMSTQQAHARYVVLLTPAEVRWRVRVLEAE